LNAPISGQPETGAPLLTLEQIDSGQREQQRSRTGAIMNAALINLHNYGSWIISGVAFFLCKERTTLSLIPPPLVIGRRLFLFKTQRVLHRESGQIVTLALGSAVEFYTFRNIFIREDYNLPKLVQWPSVKRAYDQILAAGQVPLIIDCGANIGFSAIYFALQFPAADIVAIEPQRQNFERACAATQRFERVRVAQAGIACDPGTAQVIDPGQGTNAYRTEMSDDGGIRMVTIDSVLREAGPSRIPLAIKIDIEGFESNLFKQNIGWIDRFSVLIIELHDWMLPHQSSSRNFLRAISHYDRDFVYFDENIFSIKNPAGLAASCGMGVGRQRHEVSRARGRATAPSAGSTTTSAVQAPWSFPRFS
jgi:FkbM family methyltransferase